jgi:D-alanine--poly(phosphoribitol) ligase subunit 2
VKTQTESALVQAAINWVKANKLTNGANHVQITEDTNLFESGLLDSFGFVELILFLENQGGCKIDLTDVDPAEFSVVKGLCRIALGNHQ